MAYRLITAEMRDNVMQYLADNFKPKTLVTNRSIEKMLGELDLSFAELDCILDGFERDGLISGLNFRKSGLSVIVLDNLFRLLQLGGFTGELAKLKAELQLLESELKALPSDSRTGAISTITNVLNLVQSIGFGVLGKI